MFFLPCLRVMCSGMRFSRIPLTTNFRTGYMIYARMYVQSSMIKKSTSRERGGMELYVVCNIVSGRIGDIAIAHHDHHGHASIMAYGRARVRVI